VRDPPLKWSNHIQWPHEVKQVFSPSTSSTLRLSQQQEQTRAEAAIKAITSTFSTPKTGGQLNFLHLDLNDLLSVKAAATSFASQESKLEVLWNNTGTGPNGFKEG
jgi:NAD(P)-dependent dehydrogenase (short-subunit alcohol dehydrogenase family)